ncbi:MAG: M20/M25/M40 family metallo-hydrolase [Gemmatimonadota bacterium]
MRVRAPMVVLCGALAYAVGTQAQTPAPAPADDAVRTLVGRLELERYKTTIKDLTQFGDRRQGTDRNRAAVDWIEAQLKSYGCTNTERIKYEYLGRQLRNDSTAQVDSLAAAARARAAGDTAQRGRGAGGGGRAGAAGRGGGRGGRGAIPVKGFRGPTGVNLNPDLQPDPKLRAINAQWDTPGPREEVYCTKIGSTLPGEMYIIGAHMDGHGFGAAANDDGSGTAIVMELARIFHMPDVQTERSIRFILFNNEETGGGARAYVNQRAPLQGIENPSGSGRFPEPKWLGMIQHDMMMWDHGMPGPDGKVNQEQRREADVNVEFQANSQKADDSQKLAWFFRQMNDRYATDYPAAVGDRMSNTDSGSFQDLVAAISLRENERQAHTGTGWNPTWHQPIDVFETFSDKDFRLGLNAAQTTLAAVAQLTGATLKK